ncbi:MAG: hypothetical protein WBE28_10480 [bacterium]
MPSHRWHFPDIVLRLIHVFFERVDYVFAQGFGLTAKTRIPHSREKYARLTGIDGSLLIC